MRKPFYMIFRLLRVPQWIKNSLVAAPLFVSGGFDTYSRFTGNMFFAFAAFCLLSSLVYIMNDIRDADGDRLSERKKNSPVAAGEISTGAALAVCAVLFILIVGFVCLWFVISHDISRTQKILIASILAGYAVINTAYSFGLKKIPIVDVSIIACGFMLRFLLGVTVVGAVNTVWFFLIILAASFYMGFGKRRGDESDRYPNEFLDKNIYVCQTLCIVFYTLWCIDPGTVERFGGLYTLWTVPIVFLIMLKYGYNIEKHKDGDPTSVLLRDPSLIILVAIYFLSIIYISLRSYKWEQH